MLEADGAAEQAATQFRTSEPYERHIAQRLDASAHNGTTVEAGNRRASRGGEPGWLGQLFWLTVRYLFVLKGDTGIGVRRSTITRITRLAFQLVN